MTDSPELAAIRASVERDAHMPFVHYAQKDARTLLKMLDELAAELAETQRQLKMVAPTGRYNGRNIEEWAQHGAALETALNRLLADLDARRDIGESVANAMNVLLRQSAPETGAAHTTEDDYRHFLSYSGLRNTAELQLAYYAGAGKTMEDAPCGG